MDIKKGKKAFQWIIDVIAGEIFIRTTISLLGALLATSKLYMPYLSKWLVILDIPTALGAFGLFVGFSVIFFSVVSTPYWIIRAIRKKKKDNKID